MITKEQKGSTASSDMDLKLGFEEGTVMDYAKMYEDTIKNFTEGEVVTGKVLAIYSSTKEALVDIGYKSEGLLKLDELADPASLKLGDSIEVLFERLDDEKGVVHVSKRKADRLKSWNVIVANSSEGSIIEGKIFKRVPGGFMVDIGMEAFLPASLVELKPVKYLDQYIGLQSKFKIVKINPKRKNIVLSRKDFLETEKDEMRSKRLEEIKEGMVIKGRVKNITDFGVFLDLNGADGLLHITDMSWGRISHPSELVKLGDEIQVMITAYDRTNQRISLGLKQLTPDPWKEADQKYPINTRVRGAVVNMLPYGAFVEIEKGIEGLVHVSELSWTKRVHHPSEILAMGQIVEAIVLSIDKDSRKIALGVKQIEENPWDNIEGKYPVGMVVKGTVKNLADYGAFVEIEPGIGGLVHISDMSWTKRINHPQEFLKKGDVIEASLLSLDKDNKKISLGIKQLQQDPWKELTRGFSAGMEVNGKVTKVVNFGVFIEISEGVEGLAHISELPEAEKKNFQEAIKVGDVRQAQILRVDEEGRKIALSLKAH